MLPRPKRLSRASFGPVSQGKRAVSAHFSVSLGPSGSSGAAAVISKKVARLSVDRHQLKRRLFAVASPWASSEKGFIIYTRTGSSLLSYKALKAEVEGLLSSLLTKPPSV